MVIFGAMRIKITTPLLPGLRMRIGAIVLLFLTTALKAQVPDTLMHTLTDLLSLRAKLQEAKEIEFTKLKSLIAQHADNPEQTYYLRNQIVKDYLPYNFDSALYYIHLNLREGLRQKNLNRQNEARIHLSYLLTNAGQYNEALDNLKRVNRTQIGGELLKYYFSVYVKLYTDLAFYARSEDVELDYQSRYFAYSDSLLKVAPGDSELHWMIEEKKLRDSRKMDACMQINAKRLQHAELGSRSYSMAAFERAINCELIGDKQNQKKYLMLSAISDQKAVIKDYASLTSLAMVLYDEKEIDQAHHFIQTAFEDAVFFNSRLRFIEISNILPLINQAYQIKTEAQRSKLRNTLWIISILTLLLFAAILFIYRQVKKLRHARNELTRMNTQLQHLNVNLNETNHTLNRLNSDLSESNHVKEQYIGSFLSICSNYIDKLDEYRKMVQKQIAAHKVSELFEQTKSKSLIEDELKEFYENFDHIFLHLYPAFVEEFNSLLLPEAQLVLKKGELLNTELRIFALIRLGITDSSKIAALLRYSVNTIYNYRVKIKNKASVPRDDFELHIQRIGTFSKPN